MCTEQEKNQSKSPSYSNASPQNKNNLQESPRKKPKGGLTVNIERISPADNSTPPDDRKGFCPMDYRKNPNFIPNIAEKLEKYEKLKEQTRKSIVQN
jgi:hypothetical protein